MTMCEKVHGIGSEEALRLKALKQWSEVYRARKGLFNRDMGWQAAKEADPVTWWKTWNLSSCPELMTVAMRVLAQPCPASRAERVWSSYGREHTNTRNRMSKERAKKLVKIYFNGRTVEKALKLDWVSQAFLWDESEPVADTID